MSRIEPITRDGVTFRDLNGNGRLDPFEDPRLTPEERAVDLAQRMDVDELVGLMFHTVIEAGPDGELLAGPGRIAKSGTRDVVLGKRLTHFNVHALQGARSAAHWSNLLQELACEAPHAVPVTISTDPRHSVAQNAGTSWASTFLSQWPDPMGIAALRDVEVVRRFFDVVRREYVAVGIRAALHPTADVATEPRWARQRETLGADPGFVSQCMEVAVATLQGSRLAPGSVSATTKHFPGAGPQADGEDAHFPYGRDQVYPGGRFHDHLRPFEAAIRAGTAAIMPYYGRPVGLVLDGEPVEEVGFAYNRRLLTGLLRGTLGYDGVILSDWELVNDNQVGDQVLPARAWGVEHLSPENRMLTLLEAGVDQFGGEECTDLLRGLVDRGLVTRDRLEESARRLLRVKFALGLFDDPFVDEGAAEERVGRRDDVEEGWRTQARSVVLCTNDGVLPVATEAGTRVYLEGCAAQSLPPGMVAVLRPEDADVALVRLAAPYEPRDDLFLEVQFHQGSLDFPPGLEHRLARLTTCCPLVIDVAADRPAVCTPLLRVASALTVSFGVTDSAWLAAVTGEVPPEGRLPVEFPSSMDAVRASREDVAGDTSAPLFRAGHGLALPTSQK
ncbi:glycoside hydrolase family 3 protein [Tessaracoccus antarcticus]|uniref:beta-glucosidase n=1 Tax=Tessaracoccus antarcticus TaxID=2479848 RepID=A0A3M0GB64_9ACTN|nr:glycoside hydrolase family 3 N-terminal domain-containing protein [Tessaracoccus antarcticus]RMB59732.1 glycoside hydrolase family 3 protein [Tessaracoccus antarcticus]